MEKRERNLSSFIKENKMNICLIIILALGMIYVWYRYFIYYFSSYEVYMEKEGENEREIMSSMEKFGLCVWCGLTILLFIYILCIILLCSKENNKIKRESKSINNAINMVVNMFSRFAVVDFESNSYEYIARESQEQIDGMLDNGNYDELARLAYSKFLTIDDDTKTMEDVIKRENIIKLMPVGVDKIQFEYVEPRETKYYKTLTILCLERKDGIPTRMLYASQDITKLKERELEYRESLVEAYQTAKNANSAKSNFLSKMSHDIRTPLNAIIGTTSIAKEHINDSKEIEKYLGQIESSGEHLLELINEILDMSKIEAGKYSFSNMKFGLDKLIEDLILMTKPQMKKKGIELHINLDEIEHNVVVGDRVQIKKVFLNILSNAIKYNNQGGRIDIIAKEKVSNRLKVGKYEFTFKDNGIGMTAEFVEKIFEPFERDDNIMVNSSHGTGLGMAIAYNIVKLMDGDIKVTSVPDIGSKFVVTFPLQLQDDTYDEDVCDNMGSCDGKLKDNELIDIDKDSILEHDKIMDIDKASKSEHDKLMNTNNENKSEYDEVITKDDNDKKILIVEDNETNLEILYEIINLIGKDADKARNGKEALEVFEKSSEGYYGMIFMDIQMDVMNGYDATKAIRKLNRRDSKDVPIVALTANAFAEDEINAMNAGMTEHMAKPVDIQKIRSLIEKYL